MKMYSKFVGEARRNKICILCFKAFVDNSKRASQRTCSSQCAYQFGVNKRKAQGSYKRTKKQNDKMVATIARLRTEGKWNISKEARIKLSEKLKLAWKSGKMSNAGQHMKLPEHRKRNSLLHKGRKITESTRRKMSENSRKQTHRFSRCRGGYREDLKQYFRSSWEANYARILNHLGQKWKYEPRSFDLADGFTYTPDFQLEDKSYIEIKGWLTQKGKEKLEKFKTKYPNVKLEIIDRTKYRRLYEVYSGIIAQWEKVGT